MEQIQTQLKRIPRRNDDKETLQMIEHLRKRFMDLERMRTTSLARLMQKAQRVKDANLLAIFDDFYDFGGGNADDEGGGQMIAAAMDSGSDEPRGSDSSEERRRMMMPHRVPTYHGTTVHQRKSECGVGKLFNYLMESMLYQRESPSLIFMGYFCPLIKT